MLPQRYRSKYRQRLRCGLHCRTDSARCQPPHLIKQTGWTLTPLRSRKKGVPRCFPTITNPGQRPSPASSSTQRSSRWPSWLTFSRPTTVCTSPRSSESSSSFSPSFRPTSPSFIPGCSHPNTPQQVVQAPNLLSGNSNRMRKSDLIPERGVIDSNALTGKYFFCVFCSENACQAPKLSNQLFNNNIRVAF